MHIHAGTLKTPETGRKRTKTGILAETITKTMLLYRLPIIGSYTEAPEADRRNIGHHTETADQTMIQTADRRKYIFIAET